MVSHPSLPFLLTSPENIIWSFLIKRPQPARLPPGRLWELQKCGRKEIAADGKAKSKTGNVRIRLGAALGEYVVQAQRKFVAGGVTDGPYAGNCLQPRF